jgi:hypothetical protein
MNVKDVVTQVFDRLKNEGFYSELEDKELKKVFTEYLLSEYKKEVKKQTEEIEYERIEKGDEPDLSTYEGAYAQVEGHMLYVSEELASNCKKDLEDLKYLV